MKDATLLTRGDKIGGEWVVGKYIAPHFKKEASELLAEMKLQGMMRKMERCNGKSIMQDSLIRQPTNAHLPTPDSVEETIEQEIMRPLGKKNKTGSRMTSWGPNFFKGIFNGG